MRVTDSVRSGRSPPAILMVPGWSDTSRALRPAQTFLLESGWPQSHVRAVTFRDPYGSNVNHADEIEEHLAELLLTSGEAAAAVVAHSMGGLALRRYLISRTPVRVHTAIFAGTPHRGTWAAYLAWGRGGAEMRPGSRFLEELARHPLPTSVRAICIRTPLDTRVIPGASAFLEGADCRLVRMPTHPRMLRHDGTLRLLRELLLEACRT
ncbi:hypothetical protein BH23GEM9_BH23GEM9_06060 [soil metagenome]